MRRRAFLKTAGATGLAAISARPAWALSPKFRRYKDQCHVEQDQSPDPLTSIAQSMAYLKSL